MFNEIIRWNVLNRESLGPVSGWPDLKHFKIMEDLTWFTDFLFPEMLDSIFLTFCTFDSSSFFYGLP